MIARLAQVELGIFIVPQMRQIQPRGEQRRLGEEGGVVIAAAPVQRVGEAGDFGELVAAHPLFARPDRPEPPAQVERGKLLASADDVLLFFGVQAQPEAVPARVPAFAFDLQAGVTFREAQAVLPGQGGVA